ncbi:MAG: type IV pili methyl-accepting chemotaxis transducer N-terminal domain-containing protein [Gammaproteobacteria bacterium]|nr:type IV pili methyl-accepting chemotaxis transducer N-terminal domain-containing protein [Gammaproteobacteria bacterium]
MLALFKRSLLFRAGLAVTAIASLALVSMFGSTLVAWQGEGDAAAINLAGSLRMNAYRIAWHLQQGDLDLARRRDARELSERLSREALTRVMPADPEDPIAEAYAGLQSHWNRHLLPALDGSHPLENYSRGVDGFVAEVDAFVHKLQIRSEDRLARLRVTQGAVLFLTVLILFAGMFDLLTKVLSPLKDLMTATERWRQGDRGARVGYDGEDELGLLAHNFDAMADTIAEAQGQLEARVATKTKHLEQRNRALQLLYSISKRITEDASALSNLREILNILQEALNSGQVMLCFFREHGAGAYQILRSGCESGKEHCDTSDCSACLDQFAGLNQGACSFSIRDGERVIGQLAVSYGSAARIESWELELIQAVAEQIGLAAGLRRRREQEQLLALMDERTVIARELHDSLAQALSYLKLQVGRLQLLQSRGADSATLDEVTQHIQDGLNNAYRQLRELLTTFRLKTSANGLRAALAAAAAEFSERGGLPIRFEDQLGDCPLSAHEEIHCLQIAREALSNVVRHAKAHSVSVSLKHGADGAVTLVIDDDGVGLKSGHDPLQHHGMTIMRERAASVAGKLRVENREPGGTRVLLTFRPTFLSASEEV